jgi:selenocysteine-specific elongation factor
VIPTVVVGTAGHIDHGKTTLLRALTGIDADRLPEERRRGMTIDVGYAHLALADGGVLDFVDVPGHDRLVGNMLVGAGEVDAALVVIAADDGPRAQTLEHVELLDALGVHIAIAALTKADVLAGEEDRRARVDEVRDLLARTALASAPIVVVSAETGEGLDDLRAALVALRDLVVASRPPADDQPLGRARLAVDRAFTIRGRGAVVTGTLRGGPIRRGDGVRIEPTAGDGRVRELQVHGQPVEAAFDGRTALNLAGIESMSLRRGLVVTTDPAIVATDRLLVALRRPAELAARSARERAAAWPPEASDLRIHLGTEQAEARVDRRGLAVAGPEAMFPWAESVVRLRLDREVAASTGDRFVLRRPSRGLTAAGGRVLDPRPPAGPSRRRATAERLAALAAADTLPAVAIALVELHGSLPIDRWRAIGGPDDDPRAPIVGPLVLARDVLDGLVAATLATVTEHHDRDPSSAGVPLGALRTAVAIDVRRRATTAPPDASGAATALLAGLIETGRLARDGDRVRDPKRSAAMPDALAAAMDRLEAVLAVAAPPPFADAVAATGCPAEGIRRLEASGRIIRLSPELAYAAATHRELARQALALARAGPLTPASFRDATGTSRKYVMALLEDFDRRGILARTASGHVPGPRATATDGPFGS